MKFFPKNSTQYKIKKTNRYRTCKRIKLTKEQESCFNFKSEFDIIVSNKYNNLCAVSKQELWHLTSKLLSHHIGTDNQYNRLQNIIEQAHKNLPKI